MTNNPLKPFTLLVKPVGSRCNLDCSYCFYLGTDEALGKKLPAVMPQEILVRMCEDYLSYGFPTSVFTWQGGEPALAGVDFYRRAVEAQMSVGRRGQAVANALQTNGVLIDQEWAEFLAEYRFLVGISLDGPAGTHDHFRRDRRGGATFEKVMQAVEILRRQGVEFNILSMITSLNQSKGAETYRWLTAQGFEHLQFIPCVEYDPRTGEPLPENVSPAGYGRFMSDIFDEWHYSGDAGRVSVRTFDGVVGRLAGMGELNICNMGDVCDHYLVVEKDGGVYPCDFFVKSNRHLGNLMERSLAECYLSDREKSFSLLKKDYPDKCRCCEHLTLCYGGCPKDRLTAGRGKFGRETYLCEGIRIFFDHTRERFNGLAEEVRLRELRAARQQEVPPATVPGSRTPTAVGRNDPCPCGSGKKYKHCCL